MNDDDKKQLEKYKSISSWHQIRTTQMIDRSVRLNSHIPKINLNNINVKVYNNYDEINIIMNYGNLTFQKSKKLYIKNNKNAILCILEIDNK